MLDATMKRTKSGEFAAVDTAVLEKELKARKKRSQNSRVLSIYFKSRRDLAKARRAAKRAGVPLATFIREAALAKAGKVLAA
jgi:hypothetical protein